MSVFPGGRDSPPPFHICPLHSQILHKYSDAMNHSRSPTHQKSRRISFIMSFHGFQPPNFIPKFILYQESCTPPSSPKVNRRDGQKHDGTSLLLTTVKKKIGFIGISFFIFVNLATLFERTMGENRFIQPVYDSRSPSLRYPSQYPYIIVWPSNQTGQPSRAQGLTEQGRL